MNRRARRSWGGCRQESAARAPFESTTAKGSGRLRKRARGGSRKEGVSPMLALLTLVLLAFAPVSMPQQEQGFTPAQGATLQARQESAAAQAAAARQPRYWTAYSFDVRPGVA